MKSINPKIHFITVLVFISVFPTHAQQKIQIVEKNNDFTAVTTPQNVTTEEDSVIPTLNTSLSDDIYDNFGPLPNDEVKARLDAFVRTLQNNPFSTGYFINYGPTKDVARRENLIRRYLTVNLYLDKSRFNFIRGVIAPVINTKVYIVSAGKEVPVP